MKLCFLCAGGLSLSAQALRRRVELAGVVAQRLALRAIARPRTRVAKNARIKPRGASVAIRRRRSDGVAARARRSVFPPVHGPTVVLPVCCPDTRAQNGSAVGQATVQQVERLPRGQKQPVASSTRGRRTKTAAGDGAPSTTRLISSSVSLPADDRQRRTQPHATQNDGRRTGPKELQPPRQGRL